MTKFKVGDKVKILDFRNIEDFAGGISIAMDKYIGEIHTIKSVEKYIFDKNKNVYQFEDISYVWDERALELVSDEKIVITHNGKTTTAKLFNCKKLVKTAEAKCSPEDKFNFETEAKIAVERLYEKKKLVLRSTMTNSLRGIIGKETELHDINGTRLFVGDLVELFNYQMESYGMELICHNDGYGDFVMGIAGASKTKSHHGKITNNWKIIKRKDYSCLKAGDVIDNSRVCVE